MFVDSDDFFAHVSSGSCGKQTNFLFSLSLIAMAEARSAVSEPRVGRIEEGRSPQNDFYLGIRNYMIRRFFRTRFVSS